MKSLELDHPMLLLLLIAVPVMVGLFVLSEIIRTHTLRKIGDAELIRELMPELSRLRPILKWVALIVAYIFLVVAMVNPKKGTKLKEIKREGAEVIIALDVSNSMLAEDIKPNRLERAKQSIAQILRQMTNDRIGLIVFAGDAYVQLPLTTDYKAAKMFLRSIDTGTVPTQGTDIGKAIELSMSSFTKEARNNKALIIITDGENHEENAINMASQAADFGIMVHAIGMGSPDGVPIPVLTKKGVRDYRKDKEGKVVVTKLNESMLAQIAAAGGGTYVRATNSNTGLRLIFDKIEELEKQEFETRQFKEYDPLFQYFLIFAIFFLVVEFIILPRKNKWFARLDPFKTQKK